MALLNKILSSDTVQTMISKMNRVIDVVVNLPDYSMSNLSVTRPIPTGLRWIDGHPIFKVAVNIDDITSEDYENYVVIDEENNVARLNLQELLKHYEIRDVTQVKLLQSHLYLTSAENSLDNTCYIQDYDNGIYKFNVNGEQCAIYGTIEFVTPEINIDSNLTNY